MNLIYWVFLLKNTAVHFWLAKWNLSSNAKSQAVGVLSGAGAPPLTPAAAPLSIMVPWGQSTLSLQVNIHSGSAFYTYNYLLLPFRHYRSFLCIFTMKSLIFHLNAYSCIITLLWTEAFPGKCGLWLNRNSQNKANNLEQASW